MQKRTKQKVKQESIKNWFDYFLHGEVSKNAPKYIQEACKVASYQMLQKEEKEMLDMREKREQAALSREAYVWQSGIVEGKTEGRTEERTEIVRNMLDQGLSITEIANFTGVDVDAIREITNTQ